LVYRKIVLLAKEIALTVGLSSLYYM